MPTMRAKSSNIFRYFLKVLGIVSFIAVSSAALFFAFGYQPDFTFRQIKKTSIIHVTSRFQDVKDAKIFLNDQLYAEELPAQIKGVLPGIYLLLVESPRFLPWKKELLVENDFVTKVEDVLLFPRLIEPFIKTINTFVEDVDFFWTKHYFVAHRPNQDYVTIGSFFADGTLRQQEIRLFSQNVETMAPLPDESILVHFKDSDLSEILFPDTLSSVRLRLPRGAERVTLDRERQNVFFLYQKDLWKVPRPLFDTFDPLRNFDSRLLAAVDQFALAQDAVYYLQKGQLLQASPDGEDSTVLNAGPYANLAYTSFGSEGYMVVRSCNAPACTLPKRQLYRFDTEGNRFLLTTSLSGDFLANDRGEIIFVDEGREVFLYSSSLQKKQRLLKSASPLQLLTFLNSGRHFVYRDAEALKLSDVSFSNVYSLPDSFRGSHVYAESKALYFVDGQRIQSLVLP